jgi:hypothetical protein
MSGYNPTSVQQSNLPQSTVVHHDKEFVANLKPNTPFVRCTNRRELPLNSGNQHRLYLYQKYGANAVQQAEGTVGSGLGVTVLNTTATIGQYADYVNISDLALQTAIDPALDNIAKELALRLALTLNQIVRTTADGASTIDSSVNFQVPAAAAFGRTTITTNAQSLLGRDVQPFDKGRNRLCGVIHPFIVGDALNDNTNNSVVDILKHTVEGQMKLEELPTHDGEEVQVLDWGGVSFYQSTFVTSTANYLSSGKTALRTYIFGENGVITISLGAKENAQIGEGDWRNLKVFIRKVDEPSPSDPEGVIGGWTSYNVKFVATTPPDTTMRLRTVDSVNVVT